MIKWLCVCVRARTQSCLTLCDPMDYSLPGSSVRGIFQARILEWVAIPSLGDLPDPGIESEPVGSPTLAGGFFTAHSTWEALIKWIYLYKYTWVSVFEYFSHESLEVKLQVQRLSALKCHIYFHLLFKYFWVNWCLSTGRYLNIINATVLENSDRWRWPLVVWNYICLVYWPTSCVLP